MRTPPVALLGLADGVEGKPRAYRAMSRPAGEQRPESGLAGGGQWRLVPVARAAGRGELNVRVIRV